MPPTTARVSIGLTAFLVSLSLLFSLALFGQLILVVPAYERQFADFRLRVPLVTELMIAASRFAVKYWFIVIPFLIAVFGLLGFISYWIRHHVRNRWCTACWFLLLIGLPVAANAVLWIGLLRPLQQLANGLR
jgi:type II secretory pathway component PulF